MATKKLSPNMEKVLLAADTDGWIRKSDAPTNTSVALIDRGFISTEVTKDREALYPMYGHWLTLAGKAAKAAIGLRNAELHTTVTKQIAEPSEAPEIRAGDLIEIRQPGKRRWAMRVERLTSNGWHGTQIRMTDGKPGHNRFAGTLKPGEYTIIERAKPAATVAAETRPARVTAPVKTHQSDETAWLEHRDTMADDDNMPVLSKAQVDALHWIGAPKSTPGRELYGRSGESPGVVTVKVLERYGLALLSPYRLTDAGRAAYLAHQPTGRLSRPFNDAWRAAKQAAAVEAACDRREQEIDEADEQECGTAYDHKLKLISERDGYKTWECKECGAEILEEPESPAGKGPVKVIVNVEANPTIETYEIDRAEWDAMTPGQRYKHLNGMAMEDMNNAGGCGWHIENAEDAAMVGTDPKPELPTRDQLEDMIIEYGNARRDKVTYDAARHFDRVREVLEVLYREAGR